MQAARRSFVSICANVFTLLNASCLSVLLVLVSFSAVLAPEARAADAGQIPCLTVEAVDPLTGWTTCNESVQFVTPEEAYAACVAKVEMFDDRVGCFMQPGGYFLAFTLSDRDDNRVPIIRDFILRYYYAQYCQEPAVLNSAATGVGDACMVICPADRPFNAQVRACAPEEAAAESAECETCNPINFSTGDKYLRETDYTGFGAFPLTLTRYYHSQRGRAYDGRQEWIHKGGAAPAMTVYYEAKVLFTSQRKFSPRTKVVDPMMYLAIPDPVKYRGSVGSKWGHTYDRYLLASFGYVSQNYAESPPVIRLYRPDGTVEHYRYDGGAYVAANGHTSRITSLPGGHALAPGWQVVTEDNEIEVYDIAGKLLRITNSAGLSHHLTYDAATQSKLVRVQDDFGQALEFEYGNPICISV